LHGINQEAEKLVRVFLDAQFEPWCDVLDESIDKGRRGDGNARRGVNLLKVVFNLTEGTKGSRVGIRTGRRTLLGSPRPRGPSGGVEVEDIWTGRVGAFVGVLPSNGT
jgi:hypothetical protein